MRSGLFAGSRNPIFLGMIVTMAGMLLALPNAFTLLIFFLGFVLMQIQVRLKEEFLSRAHGAEYDEFCSYVGRWL